MKKLNYLFLIIFMAMFLLIGCSNASNPKENENQQNKPDTTQQKIALYSRILGTYQCTDDPSNVHTFIFTLNSITLDDNKYTFDPSKDLYFYQELPEGNELSSLGTFYFSLNASYYTLEFIDNIQPEEEINIVIGDRPGRYQRISGGSSGGSTGTIDFSIVGDWSYRISAGNTLTTLSINDDNTFSFNKNNQLTNGTYTLSGNKITFSFNNSASEITDSFIISGNGDQMTLSLIESVTLTNGQSQTNSMSMMLLSFYSITDTSVTLHK